MDKELYESGARAGAFLLIFLMGVLISMFFLYEDDKIDNSNLENESNDAGVNNSVDFDKLNFENESGIILSNDVVDVGGFEMIDFPDYSKTGFFIINPAEYTDGKFILIECVNSSLIIEDNKLFCKQIKGS